MISIANETLEKGEFGHFERLLKQFPIVFFDRISAEFKPIRLLADDEAGGYNAENFTN